MAARPRGAWAAAGTESQIGTRVGAHGARTRRRLVAGALAVACLGAVACSDDEPQRDDAGRVVEATDWSVFDLRPGDCLDPDPERTEVSDIRVVPCVEPHTQEVFAVVEHPDEPYPGATQVSLWADGECLAELKSSYDLTLDDGVFVSYVLPTFVGWNRQTSPDRDVVCVLVFPTEDGVEGSIVAGTATIDRVPAAEPQLGGTSTTDTEEG